MKVSLVQLNRPRCITVGVISATPARSFMVYTALYCACLESGNDSWFSA